MANGYERSMGSVVAELKEEFKTFAETRYSMLVSEMRDIASAWKTNLPFIAIGALLLMTAWFLITGAVVAAVYVAFMGNAFAVAIAFAIVGVAYALLGGVAALFAYQALSDTGFKPKRTLRVLQEDRVWLNQEVQEVRS